MKGMVCWIVLFIVLCAAVPRARAAPTAGKYEIEMMELKRAISELKETVEQQRQMIQSLRMRLNYAKETGAQQPAAESVAGELDAEIRAALAGESGAAGAGEDSIGGPAPYRVPMPRMLQSLNPDISAVGDVVYDLSDNSNPLNRAVDGVGDRLSLREFELGFQAAVDPYVKGAACVGFHGEHVHVEECYAQSLSLPFGIQARGGRFFADFGKLNKVHTHDLPQVDRPLVLTRFFGQENLKGDGLGVSWLVPNPWNRYVELTCNVFNDFSRGHEHAEEDHGHEEEGNTDAEHDESEMVQRLTHYSDLMYLARASTYHDITENSNIELGVSGLTAGGEDSKRPFVEGFDLTYRWKPLREALYRSFIWRSELLLGQSEAEASDTNPWGMYSYGEYQFARGVSAGLRFDYTDVFEDDRAHEYGAGPYLTWWPSEFFRLRLQYQHITSDVYPHEDRIYLQGTFVMGAHGAHSF